MPFRPFQDSLCSLPCLPSFLQLHCCLSHCSIAGKRTGLPLHRMSPLSSRWAVEAGGPAGHEGSSRALTHKLKAEVWGPAWAFENSKATQSFPNYFHQLGTKYSNTCTYWGFSHSNITRIKECILGRDFMWLPDQSPVLKNTPDT